MLPDSSIIHLYVCSNNTNNTANALYSLNLRYDSHLVTDELAWLGLVIRTPDRYSHSSGKYCATVCTCLVEFTHQTDLEFAAVLRYYSVGWDVPSCWEHSNIESVQLVRMALQRSYPNEMPAWAASIWLENENDFRIKYSQFYAEVFHAYIQCRIFAYEVSRNWVVWTKFSSMTIWFF